MQDLSAKALDLIDQNTSPIGRSYKIEYAVSNPSMYEIRYGDNKSGDLPDALKNQLFTKRTLADFYLKKWLSKCWEEAESKLTPSQRKQASA